MNHLTHPTYIKARDLILASEERTLEDELEFGCLVNYSIWKNCKVVGRGLDPEEYHITYAYGMNENFSSVNVHPSNLEILGLPIPLDRVLMALGKKLEVDFSGGVHPDGVINLVWVMDHYNTPYGIEPKTHLLQWTLGQPLHLQLLETIEDIVKILECNQN